MNKDQFVATRLMRFFLVGVANTLLGLSIIFGAKFFFHAGDFVANFIGYGVGICLSFFLNSRWTFAYSGTLLPAVLKFVVATAVAYGANLVTVIFVLHYLDWNDYVAQAIGMPIYVVTSYLANRYIVFRQVEAAK